MNIRILGITLLMSTSTLLAGYASENKQPSTQQDFLTLYPNLREAIEERAEARKIQRTGQKIRKGVKDATKPLDVLGTTVGSFATASGDVHAKAAASAFRIGLEAVKILGLGVATIVEGVGRYKEQSKAILSNTEILLEDLTKSEEKIKQLEKSEKNILNLKAPDSSSLCSLYFTSKDEKIDVDHTPGIKKVGNQYRLFVRQKNGSVRDAGDLKELGFDDNQIETLVKLWTNNQESQTRSLPCDGNDMKAIISKGGHILKSTSTLDKLKGGFSSIYKGRTRVQRKVGEAKDIFTDSKVERTEKLNRLQADLKAERENFADKLRTLQLKVLDDTFNEINRKINIDKTIEELEKKQEYYQEAKKHIPTKSRSQAKKELAEIDAAADDVRKDLAYYLYFKGHNPPNETPDKLQKAKEDLLVEIKKLKPLTKIGEAGYLEEKGVDTGNVIKRSTIIGIYQEMDNIESRLETLEKAGAPPKPWVKATSSQSK